MPLQIADIEQYKPQTPEEKKEFFRKKAIDIMNKIEEEMKNLLKEIKKENDDRLSHELEVANMFVSHIGNYRVYLSKERIPRKIT